MEFLVGTAVGRALYGEEFTAPLAAVLEVDRNTVGKWAAGKTRVPPGVWLELAGIIQDRECTTPSLPELKVAVLQWAKSKGPFK
jgi:hypothetical protein